MTQIHSGNYFSQEIVLTDKNFNFFYGNHNLPRLTSSIDILVVSVLSVRTQQLKLQKLLATELCIKSWEMHRGNLKF